MRQPSGAGGVLLALAVIAATTAGAAAEEDPMEFQRCIWRCLSNSNGAEDPAYQACITNICEGAANDEPQSSAQMWSSAPHGGEQRRSAIGCSDGTNDENWSCLVVRCNDDGALGVFVEFSGGDVNDELTFDIDGTWIPARLTRNVDGAPFTRALVGSSSDLIDAMKRGRRVKLLDANLNPGFDTFQLSGSSRAIGRVENYCRAR